MRLPPRGKNANVQPALAFDLSEVRGLTAVSPQAGHVIGAEIVVADIGKKPLGVVWHLDAGPPTLEHEPALVTNEPHDGEPQEFGEVVTLPTSNPAAR